MKRKNLYVLFTLFGIFSICLIQYLEAFSLKNIIFGKESSRPEVIVQRFHSKHIQDLRFSADGRFIYTTSADRTLKIWKNTGELIRSIKLPMAGSVKIFPHPVKKEIYVRLYTHVKDKSMRLNRKIDYAVYNTSGKLLRKFSGNEEKISHIVFSPDGNIILTYNFTEMLPDKSGKDMPFNYVYIRDKDLAVIAKIPYITYEKIKTVAFHPDGKRFVVGEGRKSGIGWYSGVTMWNIKGQFVKEVELRKPARLGMKMASPAITNPVKIAFSSDGKFIAVVGQGKLNIRTMDGKLLSRSEIAWHGHRSFRYNCYFSPDSKSVLVSSEKVVQVFKLNGREIYTKKIDKVHYFRFSQDLRRIAALYYKTRPSVRIFQDYFTIWDGNWKNLIMIKPNSLEIKNVAFSPGGNYLYLEIEKGIKTIKFNLRKNYSEFINKSITFSNTGEKFDIRQYEDRLEFKHKDNIIKFPTKFKKLSRHYFITGSGKIVNNRRYRTRLRIYDWDGSPLQVLRKKSRDEYRAAFSPMDDYFIGFGFKKPEFNMYHAVSGEFIRAFRNLSFYVTAARISRDGKLIATGLKNGDIIVWTTEGDQVKTLKGHELKINAMDFSFDGRYLVSSSEDKTVKIWDLEKNSYLTFVAFKSGDWAAYSNTGLFDATSEGRKNIRIVKEDSIYDFQQFWDELFVSGLVSKYTKGTEFKTSDIKAKIDSAPVVTIGGKGESGLVEKRESTTVTICAKPGAGGVGNIFLFHNNRKLDENSRGLKVVPRKNCKEFTILLTPGRNEIKGAAYEKNNLFYGKSESFLVYHEPDKIKKPDMHILAVGISRYKDTNIRLESPANDARAIKNILANTGKTLYGRIKTYLLVDKKASRKNIIRHLEKIESSVQKIDTVVLFLAGHGDTEKGVYYYLPYNADITDLKGSGFSISQISKFIQKVPANKIVVLLDTCKSGKATRILGKIAMERGFEDRKIIANLAKERGIIVFSAANADQSAYEIKALKHGIFTYSILDVLKNRRSEILNGRLISMAKLLSVVNRQTRRLSEEYLKIEQSPILYMFGEDFALGIAED